MENLKNCGSGEPSENKLFQLKPYDNFLICPLMLSKVRFYV